ncbi:G2/mitotic-specific cyclin-B3-like [Mytilus californianus]|uniref:G2/mitotic-specific cyclin-B3-like n=1 Tax=Mytilus californianus TaxID=6549 RepID=UPI0022473D26|nr:G2/mitotic-specific cyclin-B3-like [Mytilus californianus]
MNTRKQKHQTGFDVKKSKAAVSQIHHDSKIHIGGFKRQGDNMADPNQKRRPAFGDITNSIIENKGLVKKGEGKQNIPVKAMVVNKLKQTKTKKHKKENLDDEVIQLSQGSVVSSSQESNSTSDLSDTEIDEQSLTFTVEDTEPEINTPEGVDNIDRENLKDIAQVALYAPFIFNYYKERELKFMVPMYMDNQPTLTTNMRSILVDWLVEVQENFELNHETLYLAVKLVDTYLSKQIVTKELLQLVGATSLFLACKFDERCPPLIEDFLYICDDAYNRREFILLEISIFKTINYDIGMPLSYRFLRRYSKCARASMETLTLARFILEMSLMEYEFIKYRESKMACACLHLAQKMKKSGEWTSTLEFYTGYKNEDILPLMKELNQMIASPPKHLNTILSKYSHHVFYEVAKIKALSSSEFS